MSLALTMPALLINIVGPPWLPLIFSLTWSAALDTWMGSVRSHRTKWTFGPEEL